MTKKSVLTREDFCKWKSPLAPVLECTRCGYRTRHKPDLWVRCAASINAARAYGGVGNAGSGHGVGSEIKKQLAAMQFYPRMTCPCNQRANEWDARGIAWCAEHQPYILHTLKGEHDYWGLNIWDQQFMADVFLPEMFRRAREDKNARP